MITLGVETSCDETSVSIVKNGRQVLSNIVFSSLKEHKKYGGVVPEIASRAHLETILPCLDLSLKKGRLSLKDIDLIAVTQGPGLMGSLLVGLSAAKALALGLRKPLVGVDHVIAHVYAGFLSDPHLTFPILGLAVSGGHTMILRMDSPSKVKILGRTLDDASGEAFDKVAKILGLRYPGGPEVDRLAKGQDSALFKFSRPFLSKDSLDFSFSGIKTAVFYKVEQLKKEKPLSLKVKKEICSGFQEAVCDVLAEKSVRAAKMEQVRSIVVGGGVSANSRLRYKLRRCAKAASIRAVFPDFCLCQDNAAMIAALGSALYLEGRRDTLDLSSYSDFMYHPSV
ncbi:MAG: tRNA (adenosine(37)-N6)-threonylcarbamoyltransferase complex transferase subunit TsaD [Candidatus Omnitrophica bacterium CG07_land_8_20_14_0_80_50_8]|nr:MAG: tRNA (adenosine(37)-N6)-threonylcarbamoyltransferase complex transferase subunit TsaD [Candidatus Omnitrophica bacterium CG1_02_49_16]PIU40713.1 MAG: tRNA (adenosine(37)-N6)-threonylcarbamoyltransferase complex transferase subunit TsaD [Candidatus Omnitrophica bacterium CG07_land_8_20_14_0_80_50_8]